MTYGFPLPHSASADQLFQGRPVRAGEWVDLYTFGRRDVRQPRQICFDQEPPLCVPAQPVERTATDFGPNSLPSRRTPRDRCVARKGPKINGVLP
jgi:hypothetical protein